MAKSTYQGCKMSLLVGNSLHQIEGLSSPSNNETSIYFTDKPLHLQISIKPDEAHFNATVRSYGWVGWGNEYGKFLRLFLWQCKNLNGSGAWHTHLATWDRATGHYEYNGILEIGADTYFKLFFDWHYRTYEQIKSCHWHLTGKDCTYRDEFRESNDYTPNMRNFHFLADIC